MADHHPYRPCLCPQRQLSLSSTLGAGKRLPRDPVSGPASARGKRYDSSVSPAQVDISMIPDPQDPAEAAASQGFSEQALQQWKVRRQAVMQGRWISVAIPRVGD